MAAQPGGMAFPGNYHNRWALYCSGGSGSGHSILPNHGDYLAIVTLAFNMIVKSVIENIDAIGGPRGIPGIGKLTTMPWVFFWTVLSLWVIRNFIYSNYGRGVLSIREDEIASDLMSVNTRQVKMLTFMVSSFFAGVGGALFGHLLQFISPPRI